MIADQNSTDPPESVKTALEEVADRYSNLARDLQADLDAAEAGEEVLELAERSTLEMLAYLPLSPVYCPFCNLHRPGSEDCLNCKYAARYGRCTEAGSVYDQALEAHYDLVRVVQDLRQGRFQARFPISAEEVRAVLGGQADRVIDLANRFGRSVREARSSEEVMTLKTEFMADLIRNLPAERIYSLCGFEHRDLFEAKKEALLGLSRHWAAA
ncbi:MAG TPA: hypothetical protein PLM24_00900 [Methanothrix sp.]|nr:hypothetical protein [Methanothrix sp.]HPR65675.1 hypothetical protein [Methanothrix sp.]